MNKKNQPGLFTAIGIGVGCMIGSGWLFAAYYAAQYIGPASFISWFLGAGLALILSLLLAEISSMFKEKALFSRLFTFSHKNADFGYVIAISSWLGLVIVIPTEASATVQYLSTAVPSFTPYLFHAHEHTLLGTAFIFLLIGIYTLLNYWGISSLAKASNIIAVFKICIPILTALILMAASFNTENLTSQGFAPYGYTRVVSAIVVCGIFYAFYGFAMIAMYSTELKNPRKNIPRALFLSVFLCLLIYLLLQAAFILALPSEMIAKGWEQINFTSPLAQLLLLLNLNILTLWSFVLYADSAISPSGTGILYLGSASRTITGMSQDRQLPPYFKRIHPIYDLSRRSLIFTSLACCSIVLFFKNWQTIMIVVTVFQLISCVSIPVSFVKLRLTEFDIPRLYRVKLGLTLSYFIYLVVSYLLTQATMIALVLALILHLIFFLFYSFTYYRGSLPHMTKALASSWSIFIYMAVSIVFGWCNDEGYLMQAPVIAGFFVAYTLNYIALVYQKNYQTYVPAHLRKQRQTKKDK